MPPTARSWRGTGLVTLLSLLLFGVSTSGAEDLSLSKQLTELGRQARAQGSVPTARTFYQKALQLDPTNQVAARALAELKPAGESVVRVAMQDPPARPADQPAAGTPADTQATLEQTQAAENLARQQLTNDVEQRLQRARELTDTRQPEAALNLLRLTQNVVRSAASVPEADRLKLERRINAQLISTVQAEERIVGERAEQLRLESAAEQRSRAVDLFQRNKETIGSMMVQFDTLMSEGVYNVLFNGGMGDIKAATQPFYEARLLAQKAYALQRGAPLPYSDNDPAPALGESVSNAMNFYNQEMQFKKLKFFRFLMTTEDIVRASVPFPDNQFIEYPDADWWRYISEKRIKRWGRAVDLFDRDPKTRQILEKLDEPISMTFQNETPLDDVLKYIKQATTTPTFSGIPIYVDPLGLQEAERSLNSTVQIDLEGVPLKTTLKLILKQLGLAYTVKDGFLMITSEDSEDKQTEIRVYPVADLAIIPMSLMMGGGGMGGGMMGGMGGMGGGMGGGMMGGMGGMGGGMMGGGMGGGMMGGMGGMMSVPPVDPQVPEGVDSAYLQKKSN
jgi:tetratricopeptide (TPR) repeat protein